MSVAEHNLTSRITYTDLYRRWEQGNWRATELDFSRDTRGLGRADRDPAQVGAVDLLDVLLRRGLGRPTTSPPTSTPRRSRSRSTSSPPSRSTRPATPSSSTASSSEVIGAGDDIAATLAFTEQQLGWGYRRSSTGSTRWPTSCAATARCRSSRRRSRSTTWSSRRPSPSPASTSSRTSSSSEGTMPGFSEGMENVSRDEQRHIGFGVKVLSRAASPSPTSARRAVDELLREVMPWLVVGLHPAELGPRVHPLLRLRARGHLRLGLQGGRDEVAGDRLPDARRCRPASFPIDFELEPTSGRTNADQDDRRRA